MITIRHKALTIILRLQHFLRISFWTRKKETSTKTTHNFRWWCPFSTILVPLESCHCQLPPTVPRSSKTVTTTESYERLLLHAFPLFFQRFWGVHQSAPTGGGEWFITFAPWGLFPWELSNACFPFEKRPHGAKVNYEPFLSADFWGWQSSFKRLPDVNPLNFVCHIVFAYCYLIRMLSANAKWVEGTVSPGEI